MLRDVLREELLPQSVPGAFRVIAAEIAILPESVIEEVAPR
jgi:hypothetical protein